MNLKDFKSIHKKYTPQQKLKVMLETADNLANARMHAKEFEQNEKSYKFYKNTEEHMWKRLEWLYLSILNDIDKLEGKAIAAEEYIMESEDYEDYKK